eukprot:11028178-Ditylum_brightwellii.AAC.1
MLFAADECKVYEIGDCPHIHNKILAPCACEWNDDRGVNNICYDYEEHPRYLQKQHGAVPITDTPNGDRNVSSFPNQWFSPSTTE